MSSSSFKIIKPKLQINTFAGTIENIGKSLIYIALTTYLMNFIERVIGKIFQTFSNFVEKIMMCLSFYLTV